jgi:uncharacterized membrane protein YdbT with pleckstrin-like domain
VAELSLNEGETIVSTVHKSPVIFWYLYLIAALFFIILGWIYGIGIVLGVLIILFTELYRRGYNFYVTNQRVIKEFTFLSRRSEDATYDLVTTVTVNQTFGARVLGVGNVVINTAGGSIVFDGVAQPGSVRSLIIKAKQDYLAGVKRVSVVLEPDKKEDAIFCPQCGHELKEISKFCPYCGGRLK